MDNRLEVRLNAQLRWGIHAPLVQRRRSPRVLGTLPPHDKAEAKRDAVEAVDGLEVPGAQSREHWIHLLGRCNGINLACTADAPLAISISQGVPDVSRAENLSNTGQLTTTDRHGMDLLVHFVLKMLWTTVDSRNAILA